MSLWTLEEKEEGQVELFDPDLKINHITRLREIGLEEGERVVCLKVLPFGGPRIFQMRDGVFSLEGSLGRKVFVRKV